MSINQPKSISSIGGALIAISGVVNTVLGGRIGALYYEVYPGGHLGHVGIISGIVAIIIGIAILFIIIPMYEHSNHRHNVIGGILTILLGHAGGIAGALYVGTVGVVLCYIGGIWLLIENSRI